MNLQQFVKIFLWFGLIILAKLVPEYELESLVVETKDFKERYFEDFPSFEGGELRCEIWTERKVFRDEIV